MGLIFCPENHEKKNEKLIEKVSDDMKSRPHAQIALSEAKYKMSKQNDIQIMKDPCFAHKIPHKRYKLYLMPARV